MVNETNGDMLDAQTLLRIESEERYRRTLRTQFERGERPRSLIQRIWKFLNSAFVLFILGSVVLTGLSAYNAKRERQIAERTARERFVSHAFTELNNRAHVAYTDASSACDQNCTTGNDAARLILFPPRLDDAAHAPIFPEFEKRSVISILKEWQDRPICGSKIGCTAIDEALTCAAAIREIYLGWGRLPVAKYQPAREELSAAIDHLRDAVAVATDSLNSSSKVSVAAQDRGTAQFEPAKRCDTTVISRLIDLGGVAK